MIKAENESLEKWRAEKAKEKVDEGTVEKLLEDLAVEAIDAPVDANVWKVEVKDGESVKAEQVVVILEAMKLEISVCASEDMKAGAKVEKVLVKPGDTIRAGEHIVLIRKS